MTSDTAFLFPSLEYLIYAGIFPLRYFTLPLEQKMFRIARTKSTCNEFRTFSKALLSQAQNQHGNTVVFKRTLSK